VLSDLCPVIAVGREGQLSFAEAGQFFNVIDEGEFRKRREPLTA
jgi:hypothetical protein